MIKLTDLQIRLTKELLLSIVRNERFIEYNELAKRIDPYFNPINVGYQVGEISKLCHELGLPLISAKVVSKGTTLTGKGFFGLYEALDISRDGLSEERLLQRELNKIHSCTEWQKLADYLTIDIEMSLPILISITLEEYAEDELIGLPEGAKKRIIVNKYERDAYNRQLCINYYKSKNNGKVVCQICGFDFGKFYGYEFSNKIHVHHKIPVSKIDENYRIRPASDLIPVCPNCHLILHSKKGGVYSLKEVTEFIKN